MTVWSNNAIFILMKRGKPLSFDREGVLKKALQIFWERGYEATGMVELLEYMGIPRQSFYNTFGNKEEILFEALEMYGSYLKQVFDKICEESATPFEKIDKILEMWEQSDSRGCFFGNCVANFGTTHNRVSEIMRMQLELITHRLAEIFQEAIDRGDISADSDPMKLATTMLTYGHGLVLMNKTILDKKHLSGTVEILKKALKE